MATPMTTATVTADAVSTTRSRAATGRSGRAGGAVTTWPEAASWLGRCPAARTRTSVRPERLPASTYRRRRAVAAGLVVVLVLVVEVALGMLGGGPLPAPERPGAVAEAGFSNETVYMVQPGDTFWSIAHRLEPDGDPRPLVDRLVAAHGGVTLHVGERIHLPTG